MKDLNDRRFIDELLDAGLAQHRGVEPRPGLENRVLARLHAEQKVPPWLAWAWRIGAGVVAIGVVVGLVSIAYRRRPQVPVSVAQSPKPIAAPGFGKGHEHRAAKSESGVTPGLVHASTSRATPGRVRHQGVLSSVPSPGPRTPGLEPRQDVFPSPSPLSEEEKLLVNYVRQLPEGALAVFPENDQPLADLSVPDLKIPPLETRELPGTLTDETK